MSRNTILVLIYHRHKLLDLSWKFNMHYSAPSYVVRTTGGRVIWSSVPAYMDHFECGHFPNDKEIEMFLYKMKSGGFTTRFVGGKDGVCFNAAARKSRTDYRRQNATCVCGKCEWCLCFSSAD
jgi:hypothetical protein